jgi:hypothetical protein
VVSGGSDVTLTHTVFGRSVGRLTFSKVFGTGELLDIYHVPNSSLSSPPTGVSFWGDGLYFASSFLSSGGFTYPVTLDIFYSESGLSVSETSLKMYRWDGTGWQLVSGTQVNTTDNYVRATVSNPGLYALGYEVSVLTLNLSTSSVNFSTMGVGQTTNKEPAFTASVGGNVQWKLEGFTSDTHFRSGANSFPVSYLKTRGGGLSAYVSCSTTPVQYFSNWQSPPGQSTVDVPISLSLSIPSSVPGGTYSVTLSIRAYSP